MSSYNFIYSENNLPHRAKTVYIYLRDRSDQDGTCWPGVKTIAKELKLSTRTVQRAIKDLEQAGLVTRKYRYRENGSHTSNLYCIQKK